MKSTKYYRGEFDLFGLFCCWNIFEALFLIEEKKDNKLTSVKPARGVGSADWVLASELGHDATISVDEKSQNLSVFIYFFIFSLSFCAWE